jgi:hypothetical protein
MEFQETSLNGSRDTVEKFLGSVSDVPYVVDQNMTKLTGFAGHSHRIIEEYQEILLNRR